MRFNIFRSRLSRSSGMRFRCTGCGGCCRKKGSVFFTRNEMAEAARALGIKQHEFRKTYITNSMDGIYEIYTPDACPLLDQNSRCRIYEARPAQCRTFPFWSSILHSARNRRKTARECPGMGRGDFITKEEYTGEYNKETGRF